MDQTTIYKTTSDKETKKIGEEFAKSLAAGDLIALSGELGAGKTTFVQGLAKGLGIAKRIISPTFVIVRSYEVSHDIQDHEKIFYHADLYRLDKEEDIEQAGLLEYLSDPRAIIAIEWPEKMKKFLPKLRYDIIFSYVGDNERSITITKRN